MRLRIKRVVLFVRDIKAVAAFYRDILGMPVKNDAEMPGWLELDGGTCTLALHDGGSTTPARRAPKIVFGAADVDAIREELVQRGARMGPVNVFKEIRFCDGKDPEGNVFQISNRI